MLLVLTITMNTTTLLISLGIGVLLGATLVYLFNRLSSVKKSVYDQLMMKLTTAHADLKLETDRLSHAKNENRLLDAKFRETALMNAQLNIEIATARTNIRHHETNLADHLEAKQKDTETVNALQREVNSQNRSIAELAANNKALTEKLVTQKQDMENMQRTAQLQFEKIANQIFEEKSTKFTETNKTNLETLLNPLKEDIGKFKTKVEETYDKESKQRFSLEEKVKELIEQTNKVSNEANNLASALKGQTKKQGNWGEMILESILESSGLTKDREYFLQATIPGEDGKNRRPDVLMKLPDNRVIIIDSKVSLLAYDRFTAAELPEEQQSALTEHLGSVKAHIDGLHEKNYDNLENSLDFTMMFIPIEPAYLLSIQKDQQLWNYAYSKRILLVSPTNLIACLKLISDLWNREKQSKNAQEIVKRGELLYDKFIAFTTAMEDLGRHIDKSQSAYRIAIDRLKTGKGNMIAQAIQLKSLGLKSSKKIPPNLIPMDAEDLQPDAEETPEEQNSNE